MAAGMPKAQGYGNSTVELPTADETQRRVAQCRGDFQRLLAQWASDCLALRRCGGSETVWTAGDECGGDITAALAA